MNKECTLTNDELIEKLKEWNSRLCKNGGRAWCLSVPVNFNIDPDILINEACDRLGQKQQAGWVDVKEIIALIEVKANELVEQYTNDSRKLTEQEKEDSMGIVGVELLTYRTIQKELQKFLPLPPNKK